MKIILSLLILLPLTAFSLTKGKPVTNLPDLVRITFSNGWVCSGAYIDPETILTAAHCLDLQSQVTKIENEEVLPVTGTKLLPLPSYDQGIWHWDDVGVIKTSPNPKFAGNFSLSLDEITSGEVTLLGTGKNDQEEYARLQGQNNFHSVAGVMFFTSGEACVARNDSGGPVVLGNKIIGVIATSMVWPCISTGTAIYPHRHFIRKILRK